MTEFNFSCPSIHNVKAVSANAQVIQGGNGEFACLTIVFHGAGREQQELEAYFKTADIQKAVAVAAAINAVDRLTTDEAEAA